MPFATEYLERARRDRNNPSINRGFIYYLASIGLSFPHSNFRSTRAVNGNLRAFTNLYTRVPAERLNSDADGRGQVQRAWIQYRAA
jgi:hypothetical protein